MMHSMQKRCILLNNHMFAELLHLHKSLKKKYHKVEYVRPRVHVALRTA